jgi:hypothetical protein
MTAVKPVLQRTSAVGLTHTSLSTVHALITIESRESRRLRGRVRVKRTCCRVEERRGGAHDG